MGSRSAVTLERITVRFGLVCPDFLCFFRFFSSGSSVLLLVRFVSVVLSLVRFVLHLIFRDVSGTRNLTCVLLTVRRCSLIFFLDFDLDAVVDCVITGVSSFPRIDLFELCCQSWLDMVFPHVARYLQRWEHKHARWWQGGTPIRRSSADSVFGILSWNLMLETDFEANLLCMLMCGEVCGWKFVFFATCPLCLKDGIFLPHLDSRVILLYAISSYLV